MHNQHNGRICLSISVLAKGMGNILDNDNFDLCVALWFGGKDAVVDWTPALKDWLRE